MTLRVLTWNVHGARDAATARIAREIADLRADVVCLNEVPHRLGAGLGRAIGARAFVAASRFGPYGNAILTTREVTSWRRLRFPETLRVDRRDAAIVEVDGISVAAVHLNLHAPKRLRDIEYLMAALPERSIVAGDMNEGPGGSVWRVLSQRYVEAGGRPTFPASEPRARIDAVWVPPNAGVISQDVIATSSSDHRIVVADLEIGW